MKLQVRKTGRRKKPITEAKFEANVAKTLEAAGRTTWHTAEKFISGIPDRYVCSGIWIEFKVIPFSGRRNITPQRYFSAAQKLWMNKLERAGDRVFGCIQFQPENGEPIILIMEWHTLRDYGPMTIKDIEHLGRKDYEWVVRYIDDY